MVIIKSGRRLCGTGGAFANTQIAQDKAYFETKIQYIGFIYSSPVIIPISFLIHFCIQIIPF